MIEISASLGGELSLGVAIQEVNGIIDQISLPAGYSLYEAGGFQAVQQGAGDGHDSAGSGAVSGTGCDGGAV